MKVFRRRPAVPSKEEVLAEARKATAALRREQAKAERYRSKKQTDPVTRMTTNQWIAGG